MNSAEIIKRGYVLEEEYDAMGKSGKLEKLNLGCDENNDGKLTDVEGIWIYPLEPSDVAGQQFHFVFFNDPLHFMGAPRAIAGMVGIGTSHGAEERATATTRDCIFLFKKTGAPAIEYFHKCAAKHEQKKERN